VGTLVIRAAGLCAGLAAFALAIAPDSAAQRPGEAAPRHVVVVAVHGAGFPYENAPEARPNLKRLRQTSRIFDAAFASTAGGEGLTEALLFGLRVGTADAGARSSVVSEAKRRGYRTVRLGFEPRTGVDHAIAFDAVENLDATAAAERARRLLDEATGPLFVYVAVDVSDAAPLTGAVEAPVELPIDAPVIALRDLEPTAQPGERARVPAPNAAARARSAAARLGAFETLDRMVAPLLLASDRPGANVSIAVATSGGVLRAGRPDVARKDLLVEDALRSYVLLRSPVVAQPGVATQSVVETADLGPTLAELLGGALDGARDGSSLAPLLSDPDAVARESALVGVDREPPLIGRTVRSATHRFTVWPDGSEELYDEDADPREWTNLAASPALVATRASLRARAFEKPVALPAAPARAVAHPAKRPNVLMIIGDDYARHVEKFATPITPNLDRLRARGRFFTRAYASAPTCIPSRASFLSGLSPLRLELHRNNPWQDVFASVPLMQEQFRAAGYFTAAVGKVWDSEPGASRGFDVSEWTPPLPDGVVEKPAVVGEGQILSWGGPTENDDSVEADGRRARLAASLIETKRDRPFFVALGLIRPHMDWYAPKKYFDLYAKDQIRFQMAPKDDGADIPVIAIRNRPRELPGLMLQGREPAGFINDEDRGRAGVAMYLATLTFMDAQVGVALDALERSGERDNTIVVFLGDNGHHFGDHGGLWRKDTLFEDSLRVPLVFAGPGVSAPGATDALADLLDLYPTLTELTGVARPPGLDGRSLASVLADPRAAVHEVTRQFRAAASPWRGYSLRTKTHRYTLWPDGGEELYALEKDPHAIENLALSPGMRTLKDRFRRSIEAAVPPLR
jgi:arylsulfatase A-like enzyme